MWIIIEIFTKRSRLPGSSDMEKSLQSCCGPFWGLEKWSNCVKLGKIHKLLQKQSIVFLFSIYFRFVFVSLFFRLFFRFCFICFRFLSVFFVFESNLTKSKNAENLEFLFVFSCFFSNYVRTEKTFSIYFQIIFESQKQFGLFSNYFRTKKEF